MEERYEALVMRLSKCRERGRKRVQQIAALMRAESIDGPVFGKEGGMVASILENALDSAEGQMRENYGKVGSGDPKTQQAAAEVGQVIRFATGDKMAVDDHRLVLEDRPGIHQVIADSQ